MQRENVNRKGMMERDMLGLERPVKVYSYHCFVIKAIFKPCHNIKGSWLIFSMKKQMNGPVEKFVEF